MFSLSTAASCSPSRWDSSRVFLLHRFSPLTQLNQFTVMLEACWRECQTRSAHKRGGEKKKKKSAVDFTSLRPSSTGLAPAPLLAHFSLSLSVSICVSMLVFTQLYSAHILSAHCYQIGPNCSVALSNLLV